MRFKLRTAVYERKKWVKSGFEIRTRLYICDSTLTSHSTIWLEKLCELINCPIFFHAILKWCVTSLVRFEP